MDYGDSFFNERCEYMSGWRLLSELIELHLLSNPHSVQFNIPDIFNFILFFYFSLAFPCTSLVKFLVYNTVYPRLRIRTGSVGD